jgi:hypothetical protein
MIRSADSQRLSTNSIGGEFLRHFDPSKEKPVQNSSEKDTQSLIEAAMNSLPPKRAANAPATARERNSIGRRDYDLALAQRLEQLRIAMGEDDQPVLPQAQAAAPSPSIRLTTDTASNVGAATLITTAIVSALAGSGLTWLILSNNSPTPFLPPERIVSIPAVVPPPLPAPALPVAATTKEETAAPVLPPQKTDDEVAIELIESWRMAWANRDVDAYLSFYSPDFVSSKGLEGDKWAEDRRKNLSSRKQISVNIHELRVERLADDQMQVSFLQDYASGNYRETAQPKTLLLKSQTDRWLIVSEWEGTKPRPNK